MAEKFKGFKGRDKNSLMYWFHLIDGLGIQTPRTEIVVLEKQNMELVSVAEGDFSPIEGQWKEILRKAKRIGYPLFMRTDEFSGKHNWKNTCYVEKEEDLRQHIRCLFEDSFCLNISGLPIRALVFREFIPMHNLFKAFHGETPINPEIRFFIKDGKVLCWHWYWIEEAIEMASVRPVDWKDRLSRAKEQITKHDIFLLTDKAEIVAGRFNGCWSVDFCLSQYRGWILIDMALGELSWHPEDCKNHEMIRLVKK